MFLRRSLGILRQCSIANIHSGHHGGITKKSLYDVLEVTPKATKNDIKKSYYRLSLIYHPDQNKNNQAASDKFREITEAYELLGDVTKRRMYDKGLYGFGESGIGEADPEDFARTYKESKKAPTTGRTQFYDFDAWTRSHYQQNISRKQFDKEMAEKRKIYKESEQKTSTSIYAIAVFLLWIAFMGVSMEEKGEDRFRRYR